MCDRWRPALFLLLVAALPAVGQEHPSFDVVSIKHVGDVQSTVIREGNMSRTNMQPLRFGGGSVSCKTTLMTILSDAYQVKSFQVQGPGWMDQDVYEIGARMPDGTSREAARLMLQSMLADRLGLKLRREQKEFAVFALVTIPGSTKLEAATAAPNTFSYRVGMDSLEADPGMPLGALASTLSRAAGRPVLDETGLKGYYKVKLQWNAEPVQPERAGGVIHLGVDSAMLSALPQIGLKVESVRRVLDNLVVEKVSKEPTEN
jgi:uncharacterized protein (TIGR03435 family)